jgi:hypothetical protein
VKKAELREQYTHYRGRYLNGEFLTNEYALHLDTMLSNYFGLPLADFDSEETDSAESAP